jgi:hypothetical protein
MKFLSFVVWFGEYLLLPPCLFLQGYFVLEANFDYLFDQQSISYMPLNCIV